tara:strand:+ start:3694 stop:3975 length:282 start_codon:yes stop_codon:yes gene_type:complete
MTLGGANVWTNFSYGYRIDIPSGWLLNPEGSKVIFFELFKKSTRKNIKIKTKIFYTNQYGQPAEIKSTNLMSREEAWNEWHDLQLKGWTFEKL